MTCCERGPEPREMGSGIKGPYQCSCTGLGEKKTTIGLSIGERTDQILQQKFREQILCSTRTSGDVCTLQHVNIVVLSDVPHECFSVCVLIDGGSWSTLVPPLPDGAFEDWTQLIA